MTDRERPPKRQGAKPVRPEPKGAKAKALGALVRAFAAEQEIPEARARLWVAYLMLGGVLLRANRDREVPTYVIKGGVALELRLRERARATKDIDLSVGVAAPDLVAHFEETLAEPYEGQENRAKRVAASTGPFVITGEWHKLMTTDCQARAPYFWYVVRAWKGNKSEGIAAGSCDTWEELADVQKANEVRDANVSVDSAWGAMSEADVYKNCANHCELERQGELTIAIGWTPVRGFEGDKRWRDPESDRFLPYGLRAIDPFLGTSDAGQVTIFLFEFASDFFKDILTNLRNGNGGAQWSVSEKMASEEYWRHMDGQLKKPFVSKMTGRVIERWVKRSRHWPDHLFASEYQSVARACFAMCFELEIQTPN